MSRLTNITVCALLALSSAPTRAHVGAGAGSRLRLGVQSGADLPPGRGFDRHYDDYGNISFADEKSRLDNFIIELGNNPGAAGYIIVYGGRVGRAGEARRRADRAWNYIADRMRGIEALRLVTVDGGYREELTVVLHIVPSGAAPPKPFPTVDPSEVKFIRTTKAKGRRRR